MPVHRVSISESIESALGYDSNQPTFSGSARRGAHLADGPEADGVACTIARMPALATSGSAGHAATTACRSVSSRAVSGASAPDSAPSWIENRAAIAESGDCSTPLGGTWLRSNESLASALGSKQARFSRALFASCESVRDSLAGCWAEIGGVSSPFVGHGTPDSARGFARGPFGE